METLEGSEGSLRGNKKQKIKKLSHLEEERKGRRNLETEIRILI